MVFPREVCDREEEKSEPGVRALAWVFGRPLGLCPGSGPWEALCECHGLTDPKWVAWQRRAEALEKGVSMAPLSHVMAVTKGPWGPTVPMQVIELAALPLSLPGKDWSHVQSRLLSILGALFTCKVQASSCCPWSPGHISPHSQSHEVCCLLGAGSTIPLLSTLTAAVSASPVCCICSGSCPGEEEKHGGVKCPWACYPTCLCVYKQMSAALK